MGFEQQGSDSGAGASGSTVSESPFHAQLIADQTEKQKIVVQDHAKQEAEPNGRGGLPGGAPGGGFHPPGGEHPPGGGQRPPQGPPEGGGGRRPPEGPPEGGGGRRPPEGPPEGGGGRRPPEGPPEGGGGRRPPEGPPEGGGGRKPPEGPPEGGGGRKPPDGPPIHHPEPHPPRPEPHPGDPHHGFDPGRHYGPPHGDRWGWEDRNRWDHLRDWDPFFFRGDPNWGKWEPNIEAEADYVAGLLDSGNAVAAANELNQDMFQMRGDIYAQDQLLSRVNLLDTKGVGADLNLNDWNPLRGTWNSISITPAPGDTVTPVQNLDPYDDFGNPI